MSTTQPIRSKQLLHDFKEYYLTKQCLQNISTALSAETFSKAGAMRCTP